MNPRKPAIAFASSSSASITSSSGAQGSEDFRLHVAVKRLIGRRCLPHQAWRRLSGVAVAFPGPERRRPTMYYSSSLPAAPAHRLHARGDGGRPGGGGAGDVLCLLMRQYVQECFVVVPAEGGRGGGCRRSPSFAPATVRRRELWSAPGAEPPMSLVCSCDSTSKRASERQEAMVEVVPTEGRDRRRISVGLWLWLGAGAQVNIAGEWQ